MEEKLLLDKFSSLPERLQQEVVDFMDFLIKEKVEKTPAKKAVFGSCKGVFKMADDFNDPLEDFKDYMP